MAGTFFHIPFNYTSCNYYLVSNSEDDISLFFPKPEGDIEVVPDINPASFLHGEKPWDSNEKD